jgi:hypothetical protein
LALLRVALGADVRVLRVLAGHHSAHELAIERVLDVEQRSGDLLERRLVEHLAVRDDRGELLRLALNLRAGSLEAEHAERVADLLQHVELSGELVDRLHARAHEDVERVFDLSQVFLDGFRNGAHELDAGTGEPLARLLDLEIAGQHLSEVVFLPQRLDARVRGICPGDVIQQAVQQLDRGRIDQCGLAAVSEALELSIGLADQPLQRDAGLETAAADRRQHGRHHGPEL